jgi:putative transposase
VGLPFGSAQGKKAHGTRDPQGEAHRQDCLCHSRHGCRGEAHGQDCPCSLRLPLILNSCYPFGVEFYRRNLPHWHPDERALFITWRLFGSLPRSKEPERKSTSTSAEEEFRKADAALDRAESGPLWLKDPRIAAIVVHAFRAGCEEFGRYVLHAYVVMANHIHLLLTPKIEVRRITKSLKGVTARGANEILRRTGENFWQDESFDHWVRNEGEFMQTKQYIEQNPVTAGLVERPEDWPWSSASRNSQKS